MDSRSSRSCTGMTTNSAREPSTLYCKVWKQAVTSIVKIVDARRDEIDVWNATARDATTIGFVSAPPEDLPPLAKSSPDRNCTRHRHARTQGTRVWPWGGGPLSP
jgi:hypothetical protein